MSTTHNTHHQNTRKTAGLTALAVGALALALTGCGAPAGADPAVPAGQSVQVQDVWVKAAETGMSAGFGQLRNTTDHDVTVTGVTSAAAGTVELHETLENESGQLVMQQKQDGFTIPAQGSLDLEPGGNHIMLMDLPAPVVAGQDVKFTLVFSDQSTLDFTAPAKDYAGANENYDGGEDAAHTDTQSSGASHDG